MKGGVTVYDMELRKAALAEAEYLQQAIRAALSADPSEALDILRAAITTSGEKITPQ